MRGITAFMIKPLHTFKLKNKPVQIKKAYGLIQLLKIRRNSGK